MSKWVVRISKHAVMARNTRAPGVQMVAAWCLTRRGAEHEVKRRNKLAKLLRVSVEYWWERRS